MRRWSWVAVLGLLVAALSCLILYAAGAGETDPELPVPVLQVVLAGGLVAFIAGLLGVAVAAVRAPRNPARGYRPTLRSLDW